MAAGEYEAAADKAEIAPAHMVTVVKLVRMLTVEMAVASLVLEASTRERLAAKAAAAALVGASWVAGVRVA